jgi:YbgC/YbaW family acyl-CoA thioester hydrolase
MQHCRLYYRIPFSETDAMAIVHHSNHARYLERGRVEFLRLAGLDYSGLIRRGIQYPVLELKCEFKKPLVFDQVILIETRIASVTRTRLGFSYRIFSSEELVQPHLAEEPAPGAPSALAETFHCCVNALGRPIEAEKDVVERLMNLSGGV